jgi:hypothetical protein
MSCERCQDLCVTYKISAPSDLKKAIAIAREHMESGTLREVDAPKPDVAAQAPFSNLAAEQPWDDFISFAFVCQGCGQRFTLTAETYHGSGGTWAPA